VIPVAAPAPTGHPVDLLAAAARLLPTVVGCPPVLGCDLHTAVLAAVDGSGDRYAALRLATRALDLFVAYLVDTGQAPPDVRASHALRAWLRGRDPAGVGQALAAAADHWRRRRS
jgi:hypothetical protein